MSDIEERARLRALQQAFVHLLHCLPDWQRVEVAGALYEAADRADQLPANDAMEGGLNGAVMADAYRNLRQQVFQLPVP